MPHELLSIAGDSDSATQVEVVLKDADTRFVVETTTSATAGLEKLADTNFDCIVSEYKMPGMDGLGLAKAVRAEYPHLPFILYPTQGDETVASKAFAAGVTDYIPRDPETDQSTLLADRIESAIYAHSDKSDQQAQQLALLKQAIDTANIPLTLTDPAQEDNPLVYVNDAFERITGYSAAECLGWNCRFLQGADTDPEAITKLREAIDNEEAVTVELRNYRKDGSLFWNRVTVDPIYDADGNLIRYLGSQRDITERKQREQELHERDQILREMYEITADGSRSFTEKVETLLELGQEVFGLSYGILSQVKDSEYTFEIVEAPEEWFDAGDVVELSDMYCEQTITSQQTQTITETSKHAQAETRSRPTEWESTCYIGTPVFVDDDVYGTLCFYDTTPREDEFTEWETTLFELMSQWVSYELERREEAKRLATQNERLEEFVDIISHDLRNPLNVAQSRLELVERECHSEHLKYIKNAHKRTQTLIDDLRTIAQQGDTVRETHTVDLETTVEHCWQTVETGDASLDIEETATLIADPSRLQQLFENLVRNALDHSDGEPAIRVGLIEPIHMSTRATEDISPEGFFIADDGPGIPKDERDKLFQSGYTTSEEGTGFGLAIVEQIVKAHDWTISAAQSRSGGARFDITGVEFVSD